VKIDQPSIGFMATRRELANTSESTRSFVLSSVWKLQLKLHVPRLAEVVARMIQLMLSKQKKASGKVPVSGLPKITGE